MVTTLVKVLRPQQWYKNFLLFLGIVFSLNFFNLSLLLDIIFAFIIFCLLSGSCYIINDIVDIEKDRKHPIKRKRPIASGKLKVSYAIFYSFVLIVICLLGAYLINLEFFTISVLFLISNFLYSFWLKHFILVDILTVSVNYIIRANAGVLAIKVPLSPWITLCAFLLALLLASGKRRHELLLLGKRRGIHRKTLTKYSSEMLSQIISISSGALIMSYSLYTFFADSPWMIITIPIASYTIFRYLFLVYSKDVGGDPGKIVFKDKGIITSMILWVLLSFLILYNIPLL